MKTTLLRLSRRAACLVLAGGLLTSCSLLPAASPRPEGTASSQAPQYYSDAWLSDDSLHYVYSYAGNGGGTILDHTLQVSAEQVLESGADQRGRPFCPRRLCVQ